MSSSPAPYNPPPEKGPGVKIAILFGLVIALIGANVYLFLQLNSVQTDLTKTKDALTNELERVKETSTLNTQAHRKNIEQLQERLEAARRQANMAAGQAKLDAIKHTEELTTQLEKEQKQATEQVNAAISEVKQDTSSKLGAVNTDLGTVKTDLGSTKSELEKTIANLKVVTGDLSTQGSRIATNQNELQALKQLGERNYFEFKLGKSKEPQKVGDVAILLKKADPKHNRYTIEITADDKHVEKKDKTVNEPVQFLTSKAHQPYEIVVNDVKKDQIAGYLATPKVQTVRN